MEFNFEEDVKDLRKSVLIFIIPFVILFGMFFYYSEQIINLILNLNSISINSLVTITPLESIQTQINTSITLALACSIPLILFGIYLFCKPIINNFKVKYYILSSIVLSWIGFVFGSTLFSKYIIESFQYYNLTNTMWSIKSVLSLILSFGFALSLIFQVIIIVPLIINLGLIKRETLIKKSLWIFLGIAILSAVITPPDIFSQIVVSVPFYCSFWIGILINKFQEVKNDWIK